LRQGEEEETRFIEEMGSGFSGTAATFLLLNRLLREALRRIPSQKDEEPRASHVVQDESRQRKG